MPKDQVKRSSVKLSILPVGRKFLMIRDGKQLLMLKAIGGSRSVYSIEEKGIPRTGITRSGKRHFQFSLPKFVNGLEGMNDHSQKSDHVVDQNLHSRVGSTQPKKNFAKKSTGNNVKRTINRLKGSSAGKSGQQHSKQSLSSSAKKTLPNSADNIDQTGSAQRDKNCNNVQSEAFRLSKSASKTEDGSTEKLQMVKETKAGKTSDTGIKHIQERKIVTDRVVNQRSDSLVFPSNDSLKREKVNLEVTKEVKKDNQDLGNKENHPKVKEVQTSKEQPSGKVVCKQRTEHTISSSKEQTSSTGNNTEKNVTDGKAIAQNTNKNDNSSTPNHVSSVEKITRLSNCPKSSTRSAKHTEKLTSMKESHSPKELAIAADVRRKRSSTPTPESPVKKSVLGRLARKRHRSASPGSITSSTGNKSASKVVNQNVKPNRESIILDSKNFEKVRNACKNAISQRKEKTSLDKGNSDLTQTRKKQSGAIKGGVKNDCTSTKRGCEEKVSEADVPPAKKKKVSNTIDVQQDTCGNDNISTVASRSSDSEDGLTKLMKDFQSAMSSTSLKKTLTATCTSSLKGNIRYISKKTSRHLVDGKPTKSVTGNLVQNESKAAEKKIVSTKSVGVSSEINILQPEDISSDEDFELSQESHMDTTSKEASEIPSNGDLLSKEKEPCQLSIKIPKTNISPSKGNFLVVDEVGFTPHDSNSSQGIPLSPEQHTQSPNTSNKLVGTNSSLTLLSDNAVAEDKCALPVVTGEVEVAKAEQGQSVVKTEKLAEEEKKLKDSTSMEVKDTRSTFTQTDHPAEKKDMASETIMLKPEVKDQSVQFSSVTNSVDPEEITPIVTAMFESECEEKERLKKALDEKIGKEEKWRNMVKDLCKQLRELRQQLSKKEPEKHIRNVGINTISEASALPVIISTQATQTAYCESTAVSVKPDPCQQTTEGQNKVPTERTAIQLQSTSANSSCHEPNKLDALTSSPSSQVIMSEDRVAHSVGNVAMNLTTTVQSQCAHAGLTNGTKVTEKSSEATEVIDLTDSEDVSLLDSKTQAKKSPVQSRPPSKIAMNHQGVPTTGQNVLPTSSTLQSRNKSPAKDQPHAIITRPVTSQAGLLHVPSHNSLQSTKTIPAIIRPPVSSTQSMQRSIQNRPMQISLNSVNSRTSAAPVVTQLIATQAKQSVPPPLQPAPTIAAPVYNQSQTSQLPMLSPNLGMLVRTQTPQRQDVVLSGVPQQMVQHHGLTPLQQQQVKNSVLIEEFKRGMLRPGLSTYQGSTSIILPSGSHQVTTLPLRLPQALPQVQSTLQGKKGMMLDDKRDGLQRQFQQAYQLNNTQKHIGNAPQLKAVLSEHKEVEGEKHMQNFRNFKGAVPSSQVHRYPQPPAYSSSSATVQPVSHISTSTVRTLTANALQQREVVNGVKQYVPLTSLSTQPRNTVQVGSGRTWFPNSRQGEIAGQINQGNPTQHIINVTAKSQPKHPASLPVLQSSLSIVDKGSLLPSPSIRISHSPEGVVLSWNITTNQDHPTVKKYFLYAYQVLNTPPSTSHWKRIGEVGALPPPMACTLNQFQPGSTYFLAICGVDVYDRPGWFSKTEEVVIPC